MSKWVVRFSFYVIPISRRSTTRWLLHNIALRYATNNYWDKSVYLSFSQFFSLWVSEWLVRFSFYVTPHFQVWHLTKYRENSWWFSTNLRDESFDACPSACFCSVLKKLYIISSSKWPDHSVSVSEITCSLAPYAKHWHVLTDEGRHVHIEAIGWSSCHKVRVSRRWKYVHLDAVWRLSHHKTLGISW